MATRDLALWKYVTLGLSKCYENIILSLFVYTCRVFHIYKKNPECSLDLFFLTTVLALWPLSGPQISFIPYNLRHLLPHCTQHSPHTTTAQRSCFKFNFSRKLSLSLSSMGHGRWVCFNAYSQKALPFFNICQIHEHSSLCNKEITSYA